MKNRDEYQRIVGKKEELESYLKTCTNKTVNFEMGTDNALGYVRDYLESYGLSVSIRIDDFNLNGPKFTDFQPEDIIVFDSGVLYKWDNYYLERYSVHTFDKPHSVNVVAVENGKVIISTWGDRYIVDQDKSLPSYRIQINVRINSKVKSR